MAINLTFSQLVHYDDSIEGINLDVVLRHGEEAATCSAKVDTGAQVCLFEREIGEALGIDIESGHRVRLRTLTGTLTAFGHEVTLQTAGLTFYTVIYFPITHNLQRNLLGRQGWLRLIRLGLVDYENTLYLGRYDDVH